MLESNSPAAGFLAGLKNWKSKPARHQKWKCVKFDNSFRVQVPARPRVGVRWGFYWRRASGYGILPGVSSGQGIRGEVSKMTKIEFSQNQDLSEPKWPGGIRDDHGKSSVTSWLREFEILAKQWKIIDFSFILENSPEPRSIEALRCIADPR